MDTASLDLPDTNHTALSQQLLGGIPVRNIWLLVLYASDMFRHLGSDKSKLTENPEDIADLVAEVLCYQVERRLIRNLSFGYTQETAILGQVRGRINSLYTESHRLLEKGKVSCTFERLTTNTPRNRYVRAALEQLAKITSQKQLSKRCRSLAFSMDRLGVAQGKPTGYSSKSERLGRSDFEDQKMLSAADLAFDLMLPTQVSGDRHILRPETDIRWLRKLFEKAIAGFYAIRLNRSKFRVSSGEQLLWQIDTKSNGIDAILPIMKTDISIENKETGERLVIDTKFNSITTKGWFREESLRSGYLYQIYTYLRSQELPGKKNSLTTSGMLLHPTIDKTVSERVSIQGHPIHFCTVNLDETATNIGDQLLNLLPLEFGGQKHGHI